jgi:hypothetical protein
MGNLATGPASTCKFLAGMVGRMDGDPQEVIKTGYWFEIDGNLGSARCKRFS